MFLLIAWFCLLNGWQTTAALVLAAFLHESGHILVVKLLGGGKIHLRLSAIGAVMQTDGLRLSYGAEIAAVLAGPAGNLLCAVAAARGSGFVEQFSGASLVLGLFNLLPAMPLDGWRVMQLLLCCWAGPDRGEVWEVWLGCVGAFSMAAALCWLMIRSGGNLWLIPPAAGFFLAAGGAIFKRK